MLNDREIDQLRHKILSRRAYSRQRANRDLHCCILTCETCGHKVKDGDAYAGWRCWCGGFFFPKVVRDPATGATVVWDVII